jgi:hypothetical protein
MEKLNPVRNTGDLTVEALATRSETYAERCNTGDLTVGCGGEVEDLRRALSFELK